MAKAVVLSEFDVKSWEAKWIRGEVPSKFPYGMEHLDSSAWDVTFPRRVEPKSRVARKIVDATTHRVGHPWVESVLSSGKVASADAVIGVLEPHIFAASAMKRARVPMYRGKALAALTCWAGRTLRDGDSTEKQRIVRHMRSLDRIYLLSRNQVEIFMGSGFREEQIRTVSYGVDVEFFTPGEPRERDIDVLAVGQDSGRDYATFFNAVRDLPIEVTLVAKPTNIAQLDIPDNVSFVGTVDHREYRSLMRRAKAVAVPTHDFAYPTGQSVALESAAVGTPVVVTGTPAMSEYFLHGTEALMPRVYVAGDWRDMLMDLMRDEELRTRVAANARRRVLQRNSTSVMWGDISEDLMGLLVS